MDSISKKIEDSNSRQLGNEQEEGRVVVDVGEDVPHLAALSVEEVQAKGGWNEQQQQQQRDEEQAVFATAATGGTSVAASAPYSAPATSTNRSTCSNSRNATSSTSDSAVTPGAYSESPGNTPCLLQPIAREMAHNEALNSASTHRMSSASNTSGTTALSGSRSSAAPPPGSLSEDEEAARDNNNGLVSARPVEDDPNMPVAIEMNDNAEGSRSLQEKEEEKANRKRKFRQAVAVFIFCAIALIVLVVLWAVVYKKKEASESATASSTTNSGASTSTAEASSFALDYAFDYLSQFLPEETINAIALNASSPQGLALQWLSQDPKLQIYSQERLLQRFVLATIYYAMGGPSWTENSYWLSHDHHECQWTNRQSWGDLWGRLYVEIPPCQSEDEGEDQVFDKAQELIEANREGFLPNDDDTITGRDHNASKTTTRGNEFYKRLWLQENNLVGSLPTEVYLLSHLKYMDLSKNQGLVDVIPTSIGQLSKLQDLRLEVTSFSGVLPSELGLLSTLTFLTIRSDMNADDDESSRYKMTGPLPSELGLLTNVEFLGIGGKSPLTGTIPTEIFQLTKLLSFDLINTFNVTGRLPTEIGKLTNLMYLWMFNNNLSGSLPSELGLMPSLAWLSLNSNQLGGRIPSEMGQMASLEELNLSDNDLTSVIPVELGQLPKINQIDLHTNQLTGTLPQSLLGNTSATLRSLRLSDNAIQGTLPSFSITDDNDALLEVLDLSHNQFTGTIPESLVALPNLQQVLMQNNNLSGPLPDSFVSNLTVFNVTNNALLSGVVPTFLCRLTNASIYLGFDCTELLCGCNRCGGVCQPQSKSP